MDWLYVILRFIHVIGGIFWVGAMMFNAAFLFPAIRDTGPAGGQVAAAVMRRGFAVITPIIALLTIISGAWLYARVSVGFQPEYMRSGPGITFGIGGAASVIGFVIGLILVRPAMMRAMQLTQSAAQATSADRDAQLAQAQALRGRASAAGNVVTALLVIAAVAMAVARYVP